MDHADLFLMLLVVGAPLALFFAMRRSASPKPAPPLRAKEAPDSVPPADYGMAREGAAAPAPSEAGATTSSIAAGAAAAAAGGAFILAAGHARSHSAEGGGESPHAGESHHGPGMQDGGEGSGADGAGDGGGGGGGDL